MSSENGSLRPSGAGRGPSPVSLADEVEVAGNELLATYKLLEKAWEKAEAKLALSHVPVDVEVELDGGWNDGNEGVSFFLGWCKVNGHWHICRVVRTWRFIAPDDEREERELKRIAECPVTVRLEMFEWFDKLYQEVVKVTKGYVPKIRQAVAKFEGSLEVLDI